MSLPQTYSLLSLGDSYTIGEMVAAEERFPNQAAMLLKSREVYLDPLKIIATTGWTTDELKDAIEAAHLNSTFDFVTLLIGVNNQYRNRDAENYRNEFKELLQIAVLFAGKKTNHVFVLSIPDWGVTPFAAGRDTKKIAAEIDYFNTINKKESLDAGANYIDITGISREAENEPVLIASDGLHPSGYMYAKWAKLLAESILKNK